MAAILSRPRCVNVELQPTRMTVLKSTKTGQVELVHAVFYKTKPILTGLRHGKLI